MAKYDYRKISVNQRADMVGELAEVIVSLKKREKVQDFLIQLLTESELVMVGRRWEIAKKLANGESYRRIARDMKVGISTIRDVDQWLNGAIGDYREKMEEEKARKWKMQKKEGGDDVYDSFDSIRYRYGLPFLLVNLLIDGIQVSRLEKMKKDK